MQPIARQIYRLNISSLFGGGKSKKFLLKYYYFLVICFVEGGNVAYSDKGADSLRIIALKMVEVLGRSAA